MESFEYNIVRGNWVATVTVNYVAEYDPDKNQTTITYDESSHRYFGRNLYGSRATTNITVTANDNPESKATATMFNEGPTDGGLKVFRCTPSPVSIVVQHSSAAGEKSITIDCASSIYTVLSSEGTMQETVTGGGTTNVVTGTRKNQGVISIGGELAYQVHIGNGTDYDLYQAYIGNGSGWDMCGA